MAKTPFSARRRSTTAEARRIIFLREFADPFGPRSA
jgi:hypothetical protein